MKEVSAAEGQHEKLLATHPQSAKKGSWISQLAQSRPSSPLMVNDFMKEAMQDCRSKSAFETGDEQALTKASRLRITIGHDESIT